VASAAFTCQVATPAITPPGGTYGGALTALISCATSGVTIYYTTDGSTPTASSAVYTAPISVAADTTIKAIAVRLGSNDSAVASAAYTIGGTGGGGPPPLDPLQDTDGDGYPDNLETAMGSDPSSAASDPFGGAGTPKDLTLSAMKLNLSFTKNTGRATVAGTVAVPVGFALSGCEVGLFLSGVARKFVLTAKGSTAPGSADKFKLTARAKNGLVTTAKEAAKFSATLALTADDLTRLAGTGFANQTLSRQPVQAPVMVLFNLAKFSATRTVSYTAKQGKTGAAK
jgi:hypothetical protein